MSILIKASYLKHFILSDTFVSSLSLANTSHILLASFSDTAPQSIANELTSSLNSKDCGLFALAHIGYPYGDAEPTFKDKELDKIIENDYTDAVQLERVTDWQWVEKRADRGDKLPLVGGWDAHRLYDIYDNEANLYTKNCTPENQIDSAPGMRTIVFAEDNSFESIKKAIREGKSVLEHVETGKLYGSPACQNTLFN